MRIPVGACLLVVVVCAGAGGCSSDDPDPDAGSGTNADGAVDVADGAPAYDAAVIADAAAGDAGLADGGLPDAGPLPDAAIEMCGRIRCDCTLNGIPLFGQVQYVDFLDSPDFQVSVSLIPDLRVLEGPFADRCGEWEIVEAFPDFTVEIVENLEDFSIAYSDFPGIPALP